MGNKKYTFTNSTGETFKLFPLNPLEEAEVRISIQNEWKTRGKLCQKSPFTARPMPPAKQSRSS